MHGLRVPHRDLTPLRETWLEHGIPAAEIDRSVAFQGLADTWWRGKDSLIAVYRGEAAGFDAPHCLRARIYGGLDAWALGGT